MEWKFLVTNGELPEKRSHHASVVAGHRLIVFGGLSQEGKRLNDMHVLDLCTLYNI
jgi:N-acetylneuraminic acid mutarotase